MQAGNSTPWNPITKFSTDDVQRFTKYVSDAATCMTPAEDLVKFLAPERDMLDNIQQGFTTNGWHISEFGRALREAFDQAISRAETAAKGNAGKVPDIFKLDVRRIVNDTMPTSWELTELVDEDGNEKSRAEAVQKPVSQLQSELVSKHIRFNDSRDGRIEKQHVDGSDQFGSRTAEEMQEPETSAGLTVDQAIAKYAGGPAAIVHISSNLGRDNKPFYDMLVAAKVDSIDLARLIREAPQPTVSVPVVTPVSKSTAKANQPSLFYGKAEDFGEPAVDWVYTFNAYLCASNELNPIPYVPTFLRGEALNWWRTFGSMEVPPVATQEQFSLVFRKKFVKPADSIKARQELSTVKQGSNSVEVFAAHFVRIRSRIVVGDQIDKSTQASYFMNGLNGNIKKVLTPLASVETVHDIELLMPAAIEAEAKISLSVKQDTDKWLDQSSAV